MGQRQGTRRIAPLAVAVVALIAPAPAQGATLTVTTQADSGSGSLRSTIARAKDGDQVRLPAGRYEVKKGQIKVGKDIAIVGAGRMHTAVDANKKSRVFFIKNKGSVVVKDMGLFRGNEFSGGAIYNAGKLSVVGSRLAKNRATRGGGAIANTGALKVKGTEIFENRVVTPSGTPGAGGAISNDLDLPESGPIRLKGVRISENSVVTGTAAQAFGGGVFYSPYQASIDHGGPGLSVKRTSITFNQAESADEVTRGGGIYFGVQAPAGSTVLFQIDQSTIANNTAISHFGQLAFGGGVTYDPLAISQGGSVTASFTTSTFADNVAGGSDGAGRGGGISSGPVDDPGVSAFAGISMDWVTIHGNRASTGPQPLAGQGGGIYRGLTGGYPTLYTSIVANNLADSGVNCNEAMGSGGYNIESAATCNLTNLGLQNTDPLLNPLADNGGPTPTMKPTEASPAVDLVPDSYGCQTAFDDQRGVDRPRGAACDTGAVER